MKCNNSQSNEILINLLFLHSSLYLSHNSSLSSLKHHFCNSMQHTPHPLFLSFNCFLLLHWKWTILFFCIWSWAFSMCVNSKKHTFKLVDYWLFYFRDALRLDCYRNARLHIYIAFFIFLSSNLSFAVLPFCYTSWSCFWWWRSNWYSRFSHTFFWV